VAGTEFVNIGSASGQFGSVVATDSDAARYTAAGSTGGGGGTPGIDIEKYVRGHYEFASSNEGLTPGFWKNWADPSHGNQTVSDSGWPATGYTPGQSYETIFGVDVKGTPSLLNALDMNGGGINALMRHSAAALLNAANPNIAYKYSVAEVIAMTKAAIGSGQYETTKNLLVVQNELGADLKTPAVGNTVVETPNYDADAPGAAQPWIPVGGKAIFTYVVSNTGNVELDVQVTDDRIPSLSFAGGDADNDGLLDPSETWTYTAWENVAAAGSRGNLGTATGDGGASGIVSDSDLAYYTGGTGPVTLVGLVDQHDYALV
jgi:hypothetical protein